MYRGFLTQTGVTSKLNQVAQGLVQPTFHLQEGGGTPPPGALLCFLGKCFSPCITGNFVWKYMYPCLFMLNTDDEEMKANIILLKVA